VRLDPLSLDHLGALCRIGLDEELWRWMPVQVRTRKEMSDYIEEALAEQAQNKALPFATVQHASGEVIGSTRFGNIDKEHRRVEIGWTWIAKPWQKTAINTEAKFLMLQHAFEILGCVRVELKTDALNERSRRAILRIGAKEEGTLSSHIVCSTGRIRDTVYFSILRAEWPQVKCNLLSKLQERAPNQ
jgi:RimJ/RimL family protein N-acetyltransferase